jgi:hypothetical protein
MYNITKIIFICLVLAACSSTSKNAGQDFANGIKADQTVVVNAKIVYPVLPDILIPSAPTLEPVVIADGSNMKKEINNQAKISGYIQQLKNIIVEVNNQYATWRNPTVAPAK